MQSLSSKTVDVRYRTHRKSVTLKNAFYNGIHLRESDSATVISLSQPEGRKNVNIDIAAIDAVRVDGRTRKLKSPGSQKKFREAELKHLLEGRKLEEWTSPYLRNYDYEGIKAKRNPFAFLGIFVSLGGMILMSLPVIACTGVVGLIGFMVWKLFVGAH